MVRADVGWDPSIRMWCWPCDLWAHSKSEDIKEGLLGGQSRPWGPAGCQGKVHPAGQSLCPGGCVGTRGTSVIYHWGCESGGRQVPVHEGAHLSGAVDRQWVLMLHKNARSDLGTYPCDRDWGDQAGLQGEDELVCSCHILTLDPQGHTLWSIYHGPGGRCLLPWGLHGDTHLVWWFLVTCLNNYSIVLGVR